MLASLSAREARALALRAQGFGAGDRPRRPIEVLQRLGALQLDSVNVLARPQDLTPFARLGPYPPEAMHRAVYHQRQGFEYWGHEASWLPMAEYRYFLWRMAAFRERARNWGDWQRPEYAPLFDLVLQRIRDEGPLGVAAFESDGRRRGPWWDYRPVKVVLEALFDRGELMCAERTPTFARLYDLPERVLPSWVDTSDPGREAAGRHLMRRAIGALGVATARDAADYFRLRPAVARPALAALVEAGEVVAVAVEGWKGPGYALPGALGGQQPLRVPRHRPVFLSPFDNLVWERARVERLFGFVYRIEIYVPEAKRQYGYYVLPLLARGQIRGRADLKLDRQAGPTLRVRGLWLEGADVAQDAADAAAALRDLAAHLGAADISVERVEPPTADAALRAGLG